MRAKQGCVAAQPSQGWVRSLLQLGGFPTVGPAGTEMMSRYRVPLPESPPHSPATWIIASTGSPEQEH